MSGGVYDNGDILEVTFEFGGGDVKLKIDDYGDYFVVYDEYEVIDEKGDTDLSSLQDEINDLKDEVKALKSELEIKAKRETEIRIVNGVKVGDRIEVVRDLMRDTRPFAGW